MGKITIKREYDDHHWYNDMELSYSMPDDASRQDVFDIFIYALKAMGYIVPDNAIDALDALEEE